MKITRHTNSEPDYGIYFGMLSQIDESYTDPIAAIRSTINVLTKEKASVNLLLKWLGLNIDCDQVLNSGFRTQLGFKMNGLTPGLNYFKVVRDCSDEIEDILRNLGIGGSVKITNLPSSRNDKYPKVEFKIELNREKELNSMVDYLKSDKFVPSDSYPSWASRRGVIILGRTYHTPNSIIEFIYADCNDLYITASISTVELKSFNYSYL